MDNNEFYQFNQAALPPEPQKSSSIKMIIIIAAAAIFALIIVIVAIIALSSPKTTEQASADSEGFEEFYQSELNYVEHAQKMFSDPAFTVLPYNDPNNSFYIDIWYVDDDITIKIIPSSCEPEEYQEAKTAATTYLEEKLDTTDLSSKYHVEFKSCS